MKNWLTKIMPRVPQAKPVVRPIPCQFECEDDTIGIFYTPEGCACFPKARMMALCAHHAVHLETDSVHMMVRWK